MEYAFEAYTALSGKLQLQPEMGLDALSGTLDRFWDEMLLDIVPLVSDIHVRSAYQILIRQAKAQAPSIYLAGTAGSIPELRARLSAKAAETMAGPGGDPDPGGLDCLVPAAHFGKESSCGWIVRRLGTLGGGAVYPGFV